MTKPRTYIDWQKTQADLRENGLLADVHEPYITPEGLRLDGLPKVFEAKRRQRSDRLTNFEANKNGIKKTRKPAKGKRGRGQR